MTAKKVQEARILEKMHAIKASMTTNENSVPKGVRLPPSGNSGRGATVGAVTDPRMTALQNRMESISKE